MLKITDDNYNNYKHMFSILWEFNARFNQIDANRKDSPLIILNNWEKKSKSLAKKGLKAGLIDAITMSMNLPIEIKKEIDIQLTSHGYLRFNQLIATVKDTLQNVHKRGKIKNIDEYYILKELCDSESDVSEGEKNELRKILEDFEMNYLEKKKY